MPPSDSDDDAGSWIPVAPRRRVGAGPSRSRRHEDRVPDLIPRLLPNEPADDDDDDDSNNSIPPLIARNPYDSSDEDDDSLPGLVDRSGAANDGNSSSSSIPDLLDPYNEDFDSSSSSSDNDEPNAAANPFGNVPRVMNPRRRVHISGGSSSSSSSGNSSGSENSNNIMNQTRARLAANAVQFLVPRIHEFSSAAALESSLRSALLFSSVMDWDRFWEGGYGTDDADGWSDGEARDNNNDVDDDSPELAEHTVTVLECGDSYGEDDDDDDNKEDRKPPPGHVFPHVEGEPWKYDDDDDNSNNTDPLAPKPPARVLNPFGHQPLVTSSMMDEMFPFSFGMPTTRERVGTTERLGLATVGRAPQSRNSRVQMRMPTDRWDFDSLSDPLEELSRPMLPSWRHTAVDVNNFSFAGTQARQAPSPGGTAPPPSFTFGTNTPYPQGVAPTGRNESSHGNESNMGGRGYNESENHADDDDTSEDEEEEEVD